ncbi:hypothetical protein NKI36_24775 [Mesorhizobium caraganae]|uniref:Uncharacterized protein n=1 Tax=Mesorhizobium caraganae TaxID=483206 RepID=A0ABV1Z5M7_9HYPH
MRLFVAVVLLVSMALFSAARGEERIALIVANPAYEGSQAIANAQASAERVVASLQSIGLVTDGGTEDVTPGLATVGTLSSAVVALDRTVLENRTGPAVHNSHQAQGGMTCAWCLQRRIPPLLGLDTCALTLSS